MSLFNRKPDAPENQSGKVTQPPVDPKDKPARRKRLEDDKQLLQTAKEAEESGDLASAQFFRRIVGD